MTVCTVVVSSWTALRMRPEVESVNQASGAWEMRSTMSRRSRSRKERSAKWVMSSAAKYRNSRAEYALTSTMTALCTRCESGLAPAR